MDRWLSSEPCARGSKVQLPCCTSPHDCLLVSSRRYRSLQMRAESSGRNGARFSPASHEASAFVRPHLKKLAPYTPIEPFEILSERLGRSPHEIIKLDANENPYGPPPEVREALASMPYPNIYPDPETRRLRAALARDNNISSKHLLASPSTKVFQLSVLKYQDKSPGNALQQLYGLQEQTTNFGQSWSIVEPSSCSRSCKDELLDLIMRCCLDPGEKIVDCPPTFTMYAFDAAVNDAEVVSVPRLPGFQIDTEGVVRAVKEAGAKLVFLTSPNNPDGSMISEDVLLQILALPVLVILDEAYIEFSTESSRLKWVERYANLIVLRTFSKSAALAGIRVGYGAFPEGLIDYFWRAKQPYNVSVASETAACAALSNPKYLKEVCEALKLERDRLYDELQGISFLEPFPSHSNYVLCNVTGRDAGKLKETLAKKYGIMVRHYAKKELSGFIRISAGKPEHTTALLQALREIESEDMSDVTCASAKLPQQVESEAQPAGSFAQ